MTYDKVSNYYANQRTHTLRALLRRDYGARCYRLTRQNDVYVYGKMPNSVTTGWYLLGSRRAVENGYLI